MGAISFDHKNIQEMNVGSIGSYEIFLSGPGGAATKTAPTATGVGGWVTVGSPLVQAGWMVTGGTWVGRLTNYDEEGIDNVVLSVTPSGPSGGGGAAAVPEPSSLALLGFGAAGLATWEGRRRNRATQSRQ
jgi:hypothetical protein